MNLHNDHRELLDKVKNGGWANDRVLDLLIFTFGNSKLYSRTAKLIVRVVNF